MAQGGGDEAAEQSSLRRQSRLYRGFGIQTKSHNLTMRKFASLRNDDRPTGSRNALTTFSTGNRKKTSYGGHLYDSPPDDTSRQGQDLLAESAGSLGSFTSPSYQRKESRAARSSRRTPFRFRSDGAVLGPHDLDVHASKNSTRNGSQEQKEPPDRAHNRRGTAPLGTSTGLEPGDGGLDRAHEAAERGPGSE